MANEVTYSSFYSAGARLAFLLTDALHETLYDPTGLRALMPQVPWVRGGSDTTRQVKVTKGAAMAARSSETSGGFSNTALTPSYFALTPILYSLKYQPSDLFKIAGGPLDVQYIVNELLVPSLDLTLTDLLTAGFSGIAGSVGTSGVDMSVDDFFDAMYYLNLQLNPAALACVLHQVQVNDLVEATRSETGPLQFRTDAQELLTAKGVGYRGTFVGVAIHQSDSCALANANADRRGAMMSSGAFKYQLADCRDMDPMVNPADVLFATEEMFVERDRDAANSLTSFYAKAYPAVSEAEDLRAVRIETDA